MTYYRNLTQNHQTKRKNQTHFKMASRASHVNQVKPQISILFICDLKATSSNNHFHIIKAEIGHKRVILVDTMEYCNVQPQISSPAPLTEYIHLCNSQNAV